MNEKEFVNKLKENGILINNEQLSLFNQYYEILIDYNNKTNLTAITDKEEVYLKHFYDSLTLLFKFQLKDNCTLCDVGAGAGFPSVPLKIMRPDLNITIVDSLGKRIDFLKLLIKELNLININAIHARAEDFVEVKREYFDVVTARAVARLNILSELCIPLVKENGLFIAMKGQSGEEELKEAKKAIDTLGVQLLNSHHFSLPGEAGDRSIFIFTKISKTPIKYPRNYSQIKNKPL